MELNCKHQTSKGFWASHESFAIALLSRAWPGHGGGDDEVGINNAGGEHVTDTQEVCYMQPRPRKN